MLGFTSALRMCGCRRRGNPWHSLWRIHSSWADAYSKHQCKHFLQRWFHMQMSAKRKKPKKKPSPVISFPGKKFIITEGWWSQFYLQLVFSTAAMPHGTFVVASVGRAELCFCMTKRTVVSTSKIPGGTAKLLSDTWSGDLTSTGLNLGWCSYFALLSAGKLSVFILVTQQNLD